MRNFDFKKYKQIIYKICLWKRIIYSIERRKVTVTLVIYVLIVRHAHKYVRTSFSSQGELNNLDPLYLVILYLSSYMGLTRINSYKKN